ncbi:MAG: hypothetical protein ABEI52_02100 [Halobacteriaceae archaeon]
MRIRDRLQISDRRQQQAARLMQLCLVGILFVGIDRGNPGIIVNSLVALLVTEVPAILDRDFGLNMDPGLVLWLTTAVFLHAVGTLGPYQNVTGFDHVTHMLSSSLVAGTGYAFARAVDEHWEDNHFPAKFTFVLILLVVLAFGVLWEVIEFSIGLAANALGTRGVLTQYGLHDSMLDLIYNTLGGLIVAIWGTAYLSGFAEELRAAIASREEPGK